MPAKWRTLRVAELTPEQLERRRAWERAREKRRSVNKKRHHRYSPEKYARILARNNAWRKAHYTRKPLTEAQLEAKRANARKRIRCKPAPYVFTGSVVASSVPSGSRDMLLALMAAVPRSDDREDIIAEAALMMLEGMTQEAAITTARKRIRKDVLQLRNAKPLDDCFWL